MKNSRFLFAALSTLLVFTLFSITKADSDEETVYFPSLRGRYSWQLLWNLDNSDSNGVLNFQFEVTAAMYSSYIQLKKSVEDFMLAASPPVNLAGTEFEVVRLEVNGEIANEISAAYKSLVENRNAFQTNLTRKDNYEVAPYSTVKIYQLVYDGPGIHYVTDTVSSTPQPIDDVIIDLTVKQYHVLESK